LCFVLFRNFVEARQRNYGKRSNMHLHILAVLFVVGVFTRVTFIAFVLPIGWQLLLQIFRTPSSRFRTHSWYTRPHLFLLPALTAALTSLAIILIDTYYFRGSFSTLVITPLNFVSYNLSPKNLAEHGLHPRWLHLVVNLPMMVGLPLLWLAVPAGMQHWRMPVEKLRNTNQIVDRSILYSFLVTITVLSIQPHQEPRFLAPCLVLFVVFVANSGKLISAGKIFWTTWITINALLACLFGVFHQGGVVPSLFYIHGQISSGGFGENVHVIYWKTYMPPRHLLAINERDVISGRISITDLAGASSSSIYRAILYPSNDVFSFTGKPDVSSYSGATTFLVTTFSMKALLFPEIIACISLDHRVFPHLDLDHIGESVREGWRDGLSLGIWKVDRTCVSDAELRVPD